MLIATVTIAALVIVGAVINLTRKNLLMCKQPKFLLRILTEFFPATLTLISAALTVGLYYAQGTATILALTSLSQALSSVASTILITVIVDIFPTTLR